MDTDLETRAIFEPIHSHTKIISYLESLGRPDYCSDKEQFSSYRSGIKITSPVNKEKSITAVITTACLTYNEDVCSAGTSWWASVAILPSKDLEDASSSSRITQ